MNIVIILAVAKTQREELADYILRICRDNNISFRQVSDRAKNRGHKIAQSYISKIVSGAAQNLSVDKLRALAVGLGRPEEEVFAIATGIPIEDDAINQAIIKAIAFGYPKLTPKDKEDIAILLRLVDREIKERLDK